MSPIFPHMPQSSAHRFEIFFPKIEKKRRNIKTLWRASYSSWPLIIPISSVYYFIFPFITFKCEPRTLTGRRRRKKAQTRIRGLGRDGLGYWSIDEASLLNCQWLMEATLMKQNSIIPVEWSSSGVRWWCGDGSERKTIAALPTTKVLACLFGRRGMINEGSIFEKWIIMMKYFSRW